MSISTSDGSGSRRSIDAGASDEAADCEAHARAVRVGMGVDVG
jgi:hypothetical protein